MESQSTVCLSRGSPHGHSTGMKAGYWHPQYSGHIDGACLAISTYQSPPMMRFQRALPLAVPAPKQLSSLDKALQVGRTLQGEGQHHAWLPRDSTWDLYILSHHNPDIWQFGNFCIVNFKFGSKLGFGGQLLPGPGRHTP